MKKHSRPIWGVVLHETQSPIGDVGEKRDAIRESHKARGWSDIGYHAILNPETGDWTGGRPFEFRGSHVYRKNNGLIGIGILGYWSSEIKSRLVPYAVAPSILEIIRQAMGVCEFDVDARFYTHSEILPDHTDCGRGPIQLLADDMNKYGMYI